MEDALFPPLTTHLVTANADVIKDLVGEFTFKFDLSETLRPYRLGGESLHTSTHTS